MAAGRTFIALTCSDCKIPFVAFYDTETIKAQTFSDPYATQFDKYQASITNAQFQLNLLKKYPLNKLDGEKEAYNLAINEWTDIDYSQIFIGGTSEIDLIERQ